MKKLLLLVGLVVFFIPFFVFAADTEKNLEQFRKNQIALKLFYTDKSEPMKCLADDEVIKIAKKCKVPFTIEDQILPFAYFSSDVTSLDKELILETGINCPHLFKRFFVKDLSYECKRHVTRLGCIEKKLKYAKKKKNCKERSPEDYGYVKIENNIKDFNELAIGLGCGIERKDKDDCVRRYLPSILGSGPITVEQVDLIKSDWKIIGDILITLEQINRAKNQSSQPSQQEQEQARSEEGYYAEQSQGNYVWVDTRSGYEKFTDKWCRCSPSQAYMLNRAAKNYFTGAPISGYEKFILRGTNLNKVIKMY